MSQTTLIDASLLESCLNLFMRYGIKSTSMIDIAHHTGTSKKVIYDLVNSKEDLVDQVLCHDYAFVTHHLNSIKEASTNAIDQLLQSSDFIIKRFGQVNHSMLYDLEKYYPKQYTKSMGMKQEFIFNHIRDNLNWGILEGYYRDDFDIETIVRFYFSKVFTMMDEQLFPEKQFNYGDLFAEFVMYHLRAISSKKGLEILAISKSLKNLNA